MDKCRYICVFLLSVLHLAVSIRTHLEGYYWRDYEGIIPEDALPGGLDRNGRLIYIGQALYKDKLIPGKIYETDKNIYYEWEAKELSTTKNVKILCSQYPKKFEWIPSKHDGVVRLTNKLLIKGGFEPGFSSYIGRAYAEGETTVGKVICQETDCLGLFITKDGKGTQHRNAFEVLTYNPKINVAGTSTNCNCMLPIDVRSNTK